MCLQIDDTKTHNIKYSWPQEFIVYKVLIKTETNLFSGIKHHPYKLNRKEYASEPNYKVSDDIVTHGLHCFIKFATAVQYKELLKRQESLNFVIVKCLVNLDDLIACGTSDPIFDVKEGRYDNSAVFSSLIPLEIIE